MNALLIQALIVISGDQAIRYYTGLLIVFVAATIFVSLPRSIYYLSILTIFAPIYLLEFVFPNLNYDLMDLVVNSANMCCFIVIMDFARTTSLNQQLSNYKYHNFVGNMLQAKDHEINMMVGNLNYFKKSYTEKLSEAKMYHKARQVSHDIRSPLSAINACMSRLKADEEASNLLKISCDRINGIAEKLLRETKGDGPAHLSLSCNLIKVLKEQIVEFNIKFSDATINFLPVSYDYQVPISETDLGNIVNIILNNACEAKKDNLQLKITISKIDAILDKNLIMVEFQDNGRGIPEDELKNIGNYGYSYGKQHGNGIGLAYVKNILQFVGGSIAFESELGQGTKISCTIPYLNFDV